MKLANKVAIVTGSGRGIGRAVTRTNGRTIMRPARPALLLLLLLAYSIPLAAQELQPGDGYALVNVNIVDVAQNRILPKYTVVVAGYRLVAVGPSLQVSPPDGVRIIDVSGKYVIPGLWDMHTHLFDVDTPGAAEVTFPLLIANGVTGVRDIGAMLDLLLSWREEVASGRVVGPRIVGTGQILDGVPVVYPLMSTVVQTPEDGRRAVDFLALRGAEFVKAYEMLRPDVFLAIVDQAKRSGLLVAAHVPLRMDAAQASDAGVRSFEHLRNIELACSTEADSLRDTRTRLLENGTSRIGMELRAEIHRLQRPQALASYDSDRCAALLQRLARNRTFQVPTMFLSTRDARRPDRVSTVRETLRFVPAGDRSDWEKWSRRVNEYTPEQESARVGYSDWLFRLVRQMRDAGVPLLAGTDISVTWIVPGFSLHEELAILVEAGLTPAEALQTATVNPADYFNAGDRYGAVQPGHFADLVLLDENPLSDIANTKRIHAVIANGKYLDRTDLDRMLDQAHKAAASGNFDRPKRPN